MELKAQSAVEYIMTYGWMLIVVALIGIALYALVGERCPESVQGLSTTDVSINQFGLDSDQNLSLQVRNNLNREVEIKEYDVNISGNDASFPVEDIKGESSLQSTETSEARLPSFKEGSQCRSIDVRIIYVDSTLGNQTVEGSIVASIGEEFEIPSSPTGLNVTEELAP